MNIRRLVRTLAALVVVLLLATGAACSNTKDESGSDKSDKPGTSEVTRSTISDTEYDESIEKIKTDVEAASSDDCKLVDAFKNNPPPDPGNKSQMKKFVTTYALLMNAIADAIGADSENASAVRSAGEQFKKVAADKNYSVTILESEDVLRIVSNDKVQAGLVEFDKLTANCPGSGGPGAVPGNTDGGPGAVPGNTDGAPAVTEPVAD